MTRVIERKEDPKPSNEHSHNPRGQMQKTRKEGPVRRESCCVNRSQKMEKMCHIGGCNPPCPLLLREHERGHLAVPTRFVHLKFHLIEQAGFTRIYEFLLQQIFAPYNSMRWGLLSHFRNVDSEVERGQRTYPRSHSWNSVPILG